MPTRKKNFSSSIKLVFLLTGLAAVIILGYVTLMQSPVVDPVIVAEPVPADEELESFLNDEMDYGLTFSRLLVGKRIERAQSIAKNNPAYETRAMQVIDSLKSRLARKAKTSKGFR